MYNKTNVSIISPLELCLTYLRSIALDALVTSESVPLLAITHSFRRSATFYSVNKLSELSSAENEVFNYNRCFELLFYISSTSTLNYNIHNLRQYNLIFFVNHKNKNMNKSYFLFKIVSFNFFR